MDIDRIIKTAERLEERAAAIPVWKKGTIVFAEPEPELVRDPRWRQPTPAMEAVALHMAVQGHFENWAVGIISDDKFKRAMRDLLNQQTKLLLFLEKGSWV
jgi:hypothetical protein